uniref:Uncharacterized protein n=1 Tax=Leersia perrieri TaxID=77586 RepID=A0A0D9WZB8_9ORYZ
MEATIFIVNTGARLEHSVLAAIADGRCTGGIPHPPVYLIGPVLSLTLSKTEPKQQLHDECVRWLDSHPPDSVLLLCFGGKGIVTPPRVTAIAAALDRYTEHRFLWVLRGPPVDRRRDNIVEAAELERAVRTLMGVDSEEGRKARNMAAEMMAAYRKAVKKGESSDIAFKRLTKEIWQGAVVPKK